jgi:hypothetical protein
MASAPTAGSDKRPLFYNLARGAKLVALLLFFLPWVTVSCAGQELVSMSGYELATGHGTVTNPMTGQKETPPGGGQGETILIVAAAVILIALVGTFVLARGLGALVGAAGAALGAVLVCYTVLVRVPARLHDSPVGAGAGGGDAASAGMNAQQIAELIKVENAPAFWLTVVALIAAIVLNLLARGRAAT